MKKRIYTSPKLISEAFIPSEYIAACYYIACDLGAVAHQMTLESGELIKYCESTYVNSEGETIIHGYNKASILEENCIAHGVEGNSGCGLLQNQYIRVTNQGVIAGLVEKNSLTNSGGEIPLSNINGSPTDGNRITWTSTSSDGREWHHTGTYSANNSHGNHS